VGEDANLALLLERPAPGIALERAYLLLVEQDEEVEAQAGYATDAARVVLDTDGDREGLVGAGRGWVEEAVPQRQIVAVEGRDDIIEGAWEAGDAGRGCCRRGLTSAAVGNDRLACPARASGAGTSVAVGGEACGSLVGSTTTEGGWRATVRRATGICPPSAVAAVVVAVDTGGGGDHEGFYRGEIPEERQICT
jgi:hypothetical protein